MVNDLSIITVTKNNLVGLKRTYQSIRFIPGIEWIVIDGESNDGTDEWLETIEHGGVKLFKRPAEGIYNAMNEGIKLSNGLWAIFMNAGDKFSENLDFENLQVKLRQCTSGIVFCRSGNYSEDSVKLKTILPAIYLNVGMITHHQAVIFNLKQVNYHKLSYREDLKIASDYELITKLVRLTAYECWPQMLLSLNDDPGESANYRRGIEEMKIIWKERQEGRAWISVKANFHLIKNAFFPGLTKTLRKWI